jgi:methyl-accepting chemotaxis protein
LPETSAPAPPALPPFIIRLRAIAAIWLVGYVAVLGLAATAIGAVTVGSVVALGAVAAGLAAVALVAVRLAPQSTTTHTVLAACLAGALMLLIGAASPLGDGAVQQAHMMYFVTNTFLLGLVSLPAMIVYNVIVVLHHVVLTFVAPALVWHSTSRMTGLADLAVHASIAVILVGPLLLLSRHLMRSAVTTEAALQEARGAVVLADAARDRQAAAERETAAARGVALAEVRTRLDRALDRIIGSVRGTAGVVHEGTSELAGSSAALDRAAGRMLDETEAASRNMTLVAAATEELAASVAEVRAQTQAAADSAHHAAAQAQAAEVTMAGLDDSTREIETVIGLISSIAQHTNLLALNATIESARAGEAGKGFAVVAGEVKQLATQTAKATDSISRQIAAMAAKTSDAVVTIGAIMQAVTAADQRVEAIAAATQAQHEATVQITESINALAAGGRSNVAQLGDVKRDISAVEARGASLRQAADGLNASVAAARQEADALLASIAA